jgi:hypothetical protein
VKWQVLFAAGRVAVGPALPVTNLKANVEYTQIGLSWDDNGADSYRVSRDDGASWTTVAPRLIDVDIPKGKTLRYIVEAMNLDGAPSNGTVVEVTTMAELKAPPPPPLPTVYLDDLNPSFAKNGWGRAAVGKSVSGGPLSVNGKQRRKGLGVHAKSVVVCPVPAGASRFVAVVGIDDSQRQEDRASVVFEVHGDTKETGKQPILLCRSPLLSAKTIQAWAFNIELNARFKELRLVVDDGGNGIACDHGNWVDAGFIVPGGK